MADALSVAELDRLADVEAQALRRHETRRELARVQRDMHAGIDGVQVADHFHVQRVIAHGDEIIFGPHQVDAHPGVVLRVHARLHRLEREQRLRKHLLRGKVPQNRPEIPDLDLARGSGLCGSAMFQLPASGFGLERRISAGSHLVAQPVVQELLTELHEGLRVSLRQLGIPADLVRDFERVAEGRRLHQFQILVVLSSGPAGHFVHPLGGVIPEPTHAVKNGKELVVLAPACCGHKTAHR